MPIAKKDGTRKSLARFTGFEKGEPFLEELDAKLAALEEQLLEGLEKDERIKAQKKAS